MGERTKHILKYILLYAAVVAFFFVEIVWDDRTGVQGLIRRGVICAVLALVGAALVFGELAELREKKKPLAVLWLLCGAACFALGVYGTVPVLMDAAEGPREYTAVRSDIVWNEAENPLSLSDGSITIPWDGGTVTLPMDDSSMTAIAVAEDDETVTVSEWTHTGLVNSAACPSHEALMEEYGLTPDDHSSDLVFLLLIAFVTALLLVWRLLEESDDGKDENSAENGADGNGQSEMNGKGAGGETERE